MRLSPQYADKHSYYDKLVPSLKALTTRHAMFDKWQGRPLYPWQFECLRIVKRQNERQILWVVDRDGNCGKTFLANYLNILYGFQLLNGAISARDLCQVISRDEIQGFAFDICRSDIQNFDYGVLEHLKNGYIMSGKYTGKIIRFEIVPVVVFANSDPSFPALSRDRWNVIRCGEGVLTNMACDPIITPFRIFPAINPPPIPDLSEDFNFKGFLETKFDPACAHLQIEQRDVHHSSQQPGTSRMPQHVVPASSPLRIGVDTRPPCSRSVDLFSDNSTPSTPIEAPVVVPQAPRPPGCQHIRDNSKYMHI